MGFRGWGCLFVTLADYLYDPPLANLLDVDLHLLSIRREAFMFRPVWYLNISFGKIVDYILIELYSW